MVDGVDTTRMSDGVRGVGRWPLDREQGALRPTTSVVVVVVSRGATRLLPLLAFSLSVAAGMLGLSFAFCSLW